MFKVPPEGHRASRKLISPRAHAVLHAPETPSRIGCLLRVESDVFYNLKTWVQARQGLLSGWPTPTYCDVTGASCETHTTSTDHHVHQPTTSAGVNWGRSHTSR